MVELGDETVSFRGQSGPPLPGLYEAHREESIVCSSKKGIVTVYDVSTRLPILSWPLTNPDKLTVAALYVPYAGIYMAVKNEMELIYWDPSVTFATNFKTLELDGPVHSLLPVGVESPVMIAVYANCTLEVLVCSSRDDDNVKEVSVITQAKKRKKPSKNPQKRVCYSMIVTHSGLPHVITIHRLRDRYSALLYSLDEQKIREIGSAKFEDQDLGDLSPITSLGSHLYLTSSSGHVFKTSLTQLIERLQFELLPVAELGLPTGLTSFNDKFIIALYKGSHLKVYESKYYTLQTIVTLEDSVQSLSQCCHGYLFFFLSSGELRGCCISSSVSYVSLADALGRGTTAAMHSVKYSMMAESGGDLAEKISIFTLPSSSSKEKYKVCKLFVKQLCSDSPDPSLLSIITLIAKFLMGEEEGHDEKVGVAPTGSTQSTTWHQKELLELIRSGKFPISLSSTLFAKALQSEDWLVLVECLEHIKCIQEDILIHLLEAVLSLPQDFSLQIDKKTSLLKDQLLWKVLCLPRNDSLLLKPLMKLDQNSVIALLETLSQCLDSCFLVTSSSDQWSRFEDAVDWISLILDSHFTRLILIPSVHPKILELRENVRSHMKTISNLSILATVDHSIQASYKRSNSHSNWLYKLDRLEIDF